MFDILIKNGIIVDGSGEPAFHGDVAVKDGKIVKIAPAIEGVMFPSLSHILRYSESRMRADQYSCTAGSAPLLSQIPPKYLVGGVSAFASPSSSL